MNDTPNPTPTPAPSGDAVKDALFKSLQLTLDVSPPLNAAPIPDTGVPVPSKITDFTPTSGSVAEILTTLEKQVTTPAVSPSPSPTPPTNAPTPTAPAPTASTPPPVAPEHPQLRKIEIPTLPKPAYDDTILPPPQPTFDMSQLDDDEQNEVQNAIFAEQKYPDRYNGLGKRVYDFIVTHKNFVKEQERENPEVSFDKDNASYQRFLQQNRPNLSVPERKRLERERLLEEAASLAERKLASKNKKLEDEIVKLKAEPLVQKTVKDFESMVKDLMPKDDDPLVEEVAGKMSSGAVTAGREFLLLANNLSEYSPRNETHKWLGEFIQEQAELYLKSNHASLKRGSRTFVPRAKFNGMTGEDRNKHFTFTDEDILQLLAMNAKAATEYHVSSERERLKKAGYTRVTQIPNTPPPVPVAPEPSPRATASVAPSAPTLPEGRQSDPFLRYMASR